ncbi:MAG: hypothetical protein ACR2JX_10180 [Mycobacteriales bacterium]
MSSQRIAAAIARLHASETASLISSSAPSCAPSFRAAATTTRRAVGTCAGVGLILNEISGSCSAAAAPWCLPTHAVIVDQLYCVALD